MNNKGFAITGILYTLFVLFLLILIAVLSGLSLSNNLMSESTESLENSLSGIKIIGEQFEQIKNNNKASFFGKYIFEINEEYIVEGQETPICTAYLDKDTDFSQENITKITFIPEECNTFKTELTLKEVYSFEDWS